jgi:hypothetical protein
MKIKPVHFLLSAVFLMVMGVANADPLSSRDAKGELPQVSIPAPGSVERRVILDAMRVKVKELHGLDVIFVVKAMNVSNGWAWVHTSPRSRDGSSLYEDFYALLCKKKSGWRIAEIPCTEPDNSECMDSPGYFRKLLARFPGLPSGILPM